jgi:release factor glutamine methyltransferase
MQRFRIPPRDVDVLLADVVGRPLTWIIAHDDERIDEPVAKRLREALERRVSGEPLQYIRGRAEFFGREFFVDDRVLIPRPETELVVEAVLDRLPAGGRVVDVGTGSGCIAVTIALEAPGVHCFAVDRSAGALAVARLNAAHFGARVAFAVSDLTSPIRGELDVIVSNPPYVATADAPTLQQEVVAHEPHLALFAGPEGLDVIDRLLREAMGALRPGGLLVFEIGYGQSSAVGAMARDRGWLEEVVIDDLAAIPRVVVLSRPAG